MIKFKLKLKKILQKNQIIYQIIFLLYKLINYPRNYLNFKKNLKIKEKSFNDYEKNKGLIDVNYAGLDLKFQAFSPLNYYHLRIGSQHENLFFKKLFKNIKKGMIIFDIGGHVGMYTIPFAKAVGDKGYVYAFEPEKIGFEYLKKNIELNKVYNTKVFPYALSSETSKANFYIRPDKDTHSLFERTLAPSKTKKQEVQTIETFKIDDLLDKGLAKEPDFIKIDTEGAELKILNGLNRKYQKLKYIFVEIHPDALKLDNIPHPEEAIEKKLIEMGFNQVEYLDKNHILAKKSNV